ncbi:hypothetical protein TNCV_524741 [Trichonephila clavipes]|nr:hypothetical protein TNCV_524741 [Trichonephila clavipes]
MDGYSSRKWKRRPTSFQTQKRVVPDDMRLASVRNHMPKIFSNYRRCGKCRRKGQEKTCYMSVKIDVPLYIATCLASFHGKYFHS